MDNRVFRPPEGQRIVAVERLNVGYKVENTRVGQVTDYDKLTIYLETDGTVTPEEAFGQAVNILLDHFAMLKGEANAKTAAPEKTEDRLVSAGACAE